LKKKAQAVEHKQKALAPQRRHCYIRDIDVSILVEYPDYRGPHNKGPEGAIYCEHIVHCYQNNIKCRYSGISPLYPDPFVPRERVVPFDSEESAGEAEPEPPGVQEASPQEPPAAPQPGPEEPAEEDLLETSQVPC
jgi:hypothetical protein